jgi:hypothetical protein
VNLNLHLHTGHADGDPQLHKLYCYMRETSLGMCHHQVVTCIVTASLERYYIPFSLYFWYSYANVKLKHTGLIQSSNKPSVITC